MAGAPPTCSACPTGAATSHRLTARRTGTLAATGRDTCAKPIADADTGPTADAHTGADQDTQAETHTHTHACALSGPPPTGIDGL